MLKVLIPIALAALSVHPFAQAQETAAGADARQRMERIRQGVASGELTREEARRLAREQRIVRRDAAQARTGATAAPGERAESNRELDRAGRDFRRERRDAQHRSGASGASIDEREARQREAIGRGAESGELTPREAERLRREQARIERHEQMARADGRFTPRERARIQRELDQAQRHIRHESHDRQRMGVQDRGNHFGHDRGRDRGNRLGGRGHNYRVAQHSGGSRHGR
jgi:hypothetical protein